MRLTTKGRFAVTAMVDLSMRQTRGPVTLAAISERQRISLSYLEQLFGKLRRAKLVTSVRGPGGGYCLAKNAGRHLHRVCPVCDDDLLLFSFCHGLFRDLRDEKTIGHADGGLDIFLHARPCDPLFTMKDDVS